MEPTSVHHVLALLVIVGYPLWDRVETRILKTASDPAAKAKSYQRIVAVLVLTAVALLITVPARTLLEPAGVAGARAWLAEAGIHPAFGIVIGAAILLGAVVPVVASRRSPRAREKVVAAMEPLRFFLPITRHERAWFAGVSIAAGICEEIIYRAFLIAWFASLPFGWPLPVSIAFAAIAFGLAHGYQGAGGILLTTFLALVFTALFYLSGSIWLPMLVHALIDLRMLLIALPAKPTARTSIETT